MVNKLYKYMELRNYFFKNPMLRVTPNHALNDPFEADPQRNQMENVYEVLADYGQCHNNDDVNQITIALELLRYKIKNYGVVAFTEDHTNLLMWSHYANEHKGMVIEFLNFIP